MDNDTAHPVEERYAELKQQFDALEAALIAQGLPARYYHFNTIHNFLDHFGRLPNHEIKQYVLDMLEGYLHEASTQGVNDRYESIILFNKYIRQPGRIYSENCGFAMRTSPLIVLMFTMPLGLLSFFVSTQITIGIMALVFFFISMYQYRKIRAGKYYSVSS